MVQSDYESSEGRNSSSESETADIDIRNVYDIDALKLRPAMMQSVGCNYCFAFANLLCALAFVARGCAMWARTSSLSAQVEEMMKAFGIAGTYLVCGVISPVWAVQISRRSYSVFRVMAVRQEHCCVKVAPWMRAYNMLTVYMVPLAQVCGILAALFSCVQLYSVKPGPDGSFVGSPWSAPIRVTLLVWFILMLTFGFGRLEEVIYEASWEAVAYLMSSIYRFHPPARGADLSDSDLESALSRRSLSADSEQGFRSKLRRNQMIFSSWSDIAKAVLLQHRLLSDSWDLQCAGGLMLVRVLVLFVASISLGALASGHPQVQMKLLFRFLGIVFAAGGVFLLWRLANITSLCNDSWTNSILAATSSYIGYEDLDSNAVSFQSLLVWLQAKNMGIIVGGVHITKEFVRDLAVKTLVYVPVALKILSDTVYMQSQSTTALGFLGLNMTNLMQTV